MLLGVATLGSIMSHIMQLEGRWIKKQGVAMGPHCLVKGVASLEVEIEYD